jgi:hypothetical protein
MDSREYNKHLLQEKLKEFVFPENEALWNRIETGLSIALPVQSTKTAIKLKALGSKALTVKVLIATASLSILLTTLLLTNKHDHSTQSIKSSSPKTWPAKTPDSAVKINNITTVNKAARIGQPLVKRKGSIEVTPDSSIRANELIIIKNLSSDEAIPNSLIDSIKPANKNILSLPDTIAATKNTRPAKEEDYYFDFQKKRKKTGKNK